ncbi:MAG: isoleucine--tRNA ligase [Candidatus Hadarchaeia archaeon]
MIEEVPKSYDAIEKEKKTQDWWESEDIYDKVKRDHKEDEDWYFLDGPPYVTGSIHLGTAINKIIKDVVLRYKTMQGFSPRKQPGWDCHGLPIEVKVEKELGVDSKKDIEEKYGIDRFINECKKWATEHIDIMTNQFQRLGVWMDWDDPYITFKNDYLESAWWTLKKAYEKNLMEKRLQVIQWCPRCETALAEHEVRGEYRQVKDPSLYARFKLTYTDNEYLLVWTTTPWTIPANVAVCVHPDLNYAKVEVGENTYIMAEALVSNVMGKLGIYNYKMTDLIKGKELEGLRYEHPLLEEVPKQNDFKAEHRVITGEHVTIEEGTGCVHTAPGHGEEDFEVGQENDLPVFSPVDGDGRFTKEGGKYEGLYVKDADEVILEDLKQKDVLLEKKVIRHSYPHCWRCKTPLIFRATDQWFLDIGRLKPQILEQNAEKVKWVPDWANQRYEDGVKSVGDWCISRQRYWGIPMPVWKCDNCGSKTVIGSKDELLKRSGGGDPDMDLHRPDVDKIKMSCSDCGGEMSRIPDVMDVWFDAGIAPWASLEYPKNEEEFNRYWPSDFIVEGEDQITKWFYSQQVTSLIAFEDLPYREALMHGFTLDEKGRAMSKSLGNVVAPEEIMDEYGADVLRFYLLYTGPVWEDLRFSWDEVEVAKRLQKVLWNSFVFATTYMSLDNFDPNDMTEKEVKNNLLIEDKWLLSRVNQTAKKVTENIEDREFHKATRELESFILEDLSRWYIKLVRKRTWIEEDDPKKELVYQTLYRTLEMLLKILSPFMPHLTEEAYQRMMRKAEPSSPQSVHQLAWPEVEEGMINERLEEDMETVQEFVESGAKARQRAELKKRWPVKKAIIRVDDPKLKESVQRLEKILYSQLNCKNITVLTEEEFSDNIDLKCKIDTEALKDQFGELAKAIENVLHNMEYEQVKEQAEKQGFVGLTVQGEKVKVGLNNLTLDALPENMISSDSPHGEVIIDTSVNKDLESERLTRDVVRRLQEMRKDMDLDMEERVRVSIGVEKEGDIELLEMEEDYIKREVRIKELKIEKLQDTTEKGFSKEWNINDNKFKLSISRT